MSSPIKIINDRGLVLLGCGKMGSAMLSGWLDAGVEPAATTVIDPNPSEWLRSVSAEGLKLNAELPKQPAVCILADKPQLIRTAAPKLESLGNSSTLFLSIAAGTTLEDLESVFGVDTPIIRAMPNTPAAIRMGITVITPNHACTSVHKDLASSLMAAVGEVVFLSDENQMNAVTSISGSGPAYVFYLIETPANAGVKQGLSAELAIKLATATVSGSGNLAKISHESPNQLRINVTSPNGTTAAALEVLMHEKNGLQPLIDQTVDAARRRGETLGNPTHQN